MLNYLCQMLKDDVEFIVSDVRTGKDITRFIPTQIIVKEEAKGNSLLPIDFLRRLIGFYGDSLRQLLLPQFLDHTMKMFTQNQGQMTLFSTLNNATEAVVPTLQPAAKKRRTISIRSTH